MFANLAIVVFSALQDKLLRDHGVIPLVLPVLLTMSFIYSTVDPELRLSTKP